MSKKLIEIASEIVQTQVGQTSMTAGDITSSLRQVFSTLQEMQKSEAGGIELAPGAAVAGEVPAEEKPSARPGRFYPG